MMSSNRIRGARSSVGAFAGGACKWTDVMIRGDERAANKKMKCEWLPSSRYAGRWNESGLWTPPWACCLQHQVGRSLDLGAVLANSERYEYWGVDCAYFWSNAQITTPAWSGLG